ncbi:MAG: hypothetical protein HQ402_03335 [Parcubacteria group bacterium]|nr:hypothetical protein [Parcubacteria group bacterium]
MCGIVGSWFPSAVGRVKSINPAEFTSLMLAGLQHRGHHAAGLVVARHGDKESFHDAARGVGLVFDVLTEEVIRRERHCHCALGHNLYQTCGHNLQRNVQPFLNIIADGTEQEQIAVSHNGNLTQNQEGARPSDSDSWCFLESFARVSNELPLHLRILNSLRPLSGAYALVYLHQDKQGKCSLVCVRDPNGFRPLYLAEYHFIVRGKKRIGYLAGSETRAFDRIGVDKCREVQPGEIVVINDNGVRSFQSTAKGWANQPEKPCVFELPYFAGVNSQVRSKEPLEALEVREALGVRTAIEFCECHPDIKVEAVVEVPDSSRPQASGVSKALGIARRDVIFRNHGAGRTFTELQGSIVEKILRKFGFSVSRIRSLKSIALVDDSIVRGNTLREVAAYIKKINPHIQIHALIAYPPVICPCFFGIAMSTVKELARHKYGDIGEMARKLNVDTLFFISYEGFFQTIESLTGYPESGWCTACISGSMPIEVVRRQYQEELVKFSLLQK